MEQKYNTQKFKILLSGEKKHTAYEALKIQDNLFFTWEWTEQSKVFNGDIAT